MKFFLYLFHKTALFMAIEQDNIDIVKILLEVPTIDVNIMCILIEF